MFNILDYYIYNSELYQIAVKIMTEMQLHLHFFSIYMLCYFLINNIGWCKIS